MPYIAPEVRKVLDPSIDEVLEALDKVPSTVDGNLNYVISRIITNTLGRDGWRYSLIARAVAVFESAKMEFYRRVALPYEDACIQKNGDMKGYGTSPATVYVGMSGESGEGGSVYHVSRNKLEVIKELLSKKPEYGPWEQDGENEWKSGCDRIWIEEFQV